MQLRKFMQSAIEVNRTAFLRNYVVRFKPRGEFCNQMLRAVVNHVILERSESRHLSEAFSEQAKNGWLWKRNSDKVMEWQHT